MDSLLSPECCETKQACDVATTINDRLATKKRRLEQELAETNEALDALNKNPEVARLLTLVGRSLGSRY